jgi:hypothetical protein
MATTTTTATKTMRDEDGGEATRTVTTRTKTTVEETRTPVVVGRRRVIDTVRARGDPKADLRGGIVPMPEEPSSRSPGSPGNGRLTTRVVAQNPRTMTTLRRYDELSLEEKVETNEKRLFETQATLVRETMKREVTENILRETAKSLSAVRKAALQGQTAEQTGGILAGSVEHQNEVLMVRVKELTHKMQELHAQHQEKEGELQSLRRLLQQRENEFDLIGERPVSINLEIKEFTDDSQFELIDQTREVLKQAQAQADAVQRLRQLDRQRTRALGDLVLTMEARRKELQEKLKESGILEDYDDERVMSQAIKGYGDSLDAVQYEGPVTSPTGRSFYVTRTATFWDRFFGIQV